jgi:AraC-like DNA-binding protein
LTAKPNRKVPDTAQDPALLHGLLRAKDRLDAASLEACPVKRLVQVSGVSEAHFARAFKQAFGIPPNRYQLTRPIEPATTLLRDTALPAHHGDCICDRGEEPGHLWAYLPGHHRLIALRSKRQLKP